MPKPPQFFLKMASKAHRLILTASGGRLGWTVADMPVIDLTTIGRHSGQKRSTMLTTPWAEGGKLAIVASAGGADSHPDWYWNIEANPDVTIRTQNGELPMRARILEGAERTEMFERIAAQYDNYADYQRGTDRVIPVVLLEPAV